MKKFISQFLINLRKINLIRKIFKASGIIKLYDWLSMPKRYSYIFKIINEIKPINIMEIGTWNGKKAKKMIAIAKKYNNFKAITYYGFDIFENMTDEKFTVEVAKMPPSQKKVEEALKKTGINIKLYKGDTIYVLPKVIKILPKMDFIFIDGGHSVKTIINDWNYAKELMHVKTVVIFDDYWNRNDAGAKPIVDKIDRKKYEVEIIPIQDEFKKKWGILKINLVKVKKIKI